MTSPALDEIQTTLSTEAGREQLEAVVYELKKVVVGQDILLERLLIALIAQGHILVEGPPGIAKTLSLKTMAQVLALSFQRIQFTPDLLPGDLTGTRIFHPDTGAFTTELGPLFAHLVLADEINRAPAKVQSALLEAMEERQVTIGRDTMALPRPFLVMATQNPLESDGTYPLPDAQMDRFLFKVCLTYPPVTDELEILHRAMATQPPELTRLLSAETLQSLHGLAQAVYVDPAHMQTMVHWVHTTRHHAKLRSGASPRGALAMLHASRARAVIQGRAYVIAEDLLTVMEDALRHRVMLTYEAQLEHLMVDDILREIRLEPPITIK